MIDVVILDFLLRPARSLEASSKKMLVTNIAMFVFTVIILGLSVVVIFWIKSHQGIFNFLLGLLLFALTLSLGQLVYVVLIDFILDLKAKRNKLLTTLLVTCQVASVFNTILFVLADLFYFIPGIANAAIVCPVIFFILWLQWYFESNLIKLIYEIRVALAFVLNVIVRVISLILAIVILSLLI